MLASWQSAYVLSAKSTRSNEGHVCSSFFFKCKGATEEVAAQPGLIAEATKRTGLAASALLRCVAARVHRNLTSQCPEPRWRLNGKKAKSHFFAGTHFSLGYL